MQGKFEKKCKAVALWIGQTHGRLLLLDVEQDWKLRATIISLRTAGAEINQKAVRGVFVGLVKSYLEKLDKYVIFEVTHSWVRSFYQWIRSLWNEIKSQFLHEISQKVFLLSIPEELITNADQTPSKLLVADNITKVTKREKHNSIADSNEKRSIILIVYESLDGLDGKILPFQLIFKWKTQRSLQTVNFPNGLCLLYNEKHWSNEKETTRLIKQVLVPYIKKFIEKKVYKTIKKVSKVSKVSL